MTDEQIVQFVLHRASINGQEHGLTSPKLVIYKRGSTSMYLAVKFNGHAEPFILRFTKGPSRGLFKLNAAGKEAEEWRKTVEAILVNTTWYEHDYCLATLPGSVKHYVSYAIIEALKTKGVGFDLFSPSYSKDIDLIRPTETYEEATIEADLMDFNLDLTTA